MRTQYLNQVFNYLMTVYLIEMYFPFQSFYCKSLQMFLHSSTLPFSQLAFYVNLHRAVIGPSATLTGRWRPDIDLRRMLTRFTIMLKGTPANLAAEVGAARVLWTPNLWLMLAFIMISLTQRETVWCVNALCGFSVLISNLFSVSLRNLDRFMYSFNVSTIHILGFISYFCRNMSSKWWSGLDCLSKWFVRMTQLFAFVSYGGI